MLEGGRHEFSHSVLSTTTLSFHKSKILNTNCVDLLTDFS